MKKNLANKKSVLIAAFFIFLVACSPKVNKRDFSSPLMDLKPKFESQQAYEKLLQNPNGFKLNWNGKVKVSEVHNVISDLIKVGETLKNEAIKKAAYKLYKKLYAENISIKSPFTKTPYMMYFKESSVPEVKKTLKELTKTLDKNLNKIKEQLQVVKSEIKWPQKAKFAESIELTATFVDRFLLKIPNLKLSDYVEPELISQINAEKKESIDFLSTKLTIINAELTLNNIILSIDEIVKEMNFSLDKKSSLKLNQGRALAKEIDSINSDQDALKAIISIWFFLDDKERESYIKPISDGLYKYLNSKNESELKCLSEKSCPSLIDGLIRDWGVLPELKKFGVVNIKKALNEKTHAYALLILEENLLRAAKNLDDRIFVKVKKNIAKGKAEIQKIDHNTNGFVLDKIKSWQIDNFDTEADPINSYDYDEIIVITKDKNIKFDFNKPKTMQIKSNTIGTSFTMFSSLWKANLFSEKSLKRTILEQINKIMGFGGLPVDGEITKGIVTGLNNSEPFNVQSAINSLISFGLNDDLSLNSPYELDINAQNKSDISADSFTDVLLGLVNMVDYLKDWEVNSFDKTLGAVKSNDIFQDSNTGTGSQTSSEKSTDSMKTNKDIFPKSQFFGLAVAQMGSLLSNLNKSFSQVALVTAENEKVWINEFLKNKDKKVLYGAIVDIINGNKGNEVKLESLYKIAKALDQLMIAAQGIEKTKFPELQKKDDNCVINAENKECKSLAQKMSENISELKKIFIPIGNTLATKMKKQKGDENSGLVFGKISLVDMSPVVEAYKLKDHLMAIEILIKVYEKTDLETYLWSAKEVYSFLQKYYNPKTNYFELDSKVPLLPDVINMVNSFSMIEKYLDDQEKIILSEKMKIWEYSLTKIN